MAAIVAYHHPSRAMNSKGVNFRPIYESILVEKEKREEEEKVKLEREREREREDDDDDEKDEGSG